MAIGSMYGRVLLMVLAAGACSHGDPARATAVECRSIAKMQAVAGLNEAAACALVRERVQAASIGGNVTIELDLSRPGSAIARVRDIRAGVIRPLPEIAVDVMDRPLGREDLVNLADAISAALTAGSRPE